MSGVGPTWPFLGSGAPIAFAHRGGAAEAPENTVAAFEAAVALGFDALETDVRVTSDGVLVTFHDAELDRATDRRGVVAELPYADVSLARIGGEPIPMFEDVLGSFPCIRFNVDAKADAAVGPMVAAVRRTGSQDRVCLGSFVDKRVRRIRSLTDGRVCTWMGRRDMLRMRMASVGVPTGAFRSPCVQVPVCKGVLPIVDGRFVDGAHRRGVVVHVWTIDDPDQMGSLLDLGVDGIMSNRPSVLKEVFEDRGLWP
ncbi:MAG: glycerophosphodiester phosphodiesterase [Acidimicrobiales bacterium]